MYSVFFSIHVDIHWHAVCRDRVVHAIATTAARGRSGMVEQRVIGSHNFGCRGRGFQFLGLSRSGTVPLGRSGYSTPPAGSLEKRKQNKLKHKLNHNFGSYLLKDCFKNSRLHESTQNKIPCDPCMD